MSLVDPRVTKQAEVLVNFSTKVKKGEKVALLSDYNSRPLALEIYKLLVKRGVLEIRTHVSDYEFSEEYFKNASKAQLNHFPEIAWDEIRKIDCYIAIRSPRNTRGLTGIDPKIISSRSIATRKIQNWRVEKTRWVLTNFPTNAQAQEAGMSLSSYEDFVFGAINDVDWKEKYKEQERLVKKVNATKSVRIVGKGTDLSMVISGRKAINAGGEYNMPDGEVFTSVVENSTEGHITYSFPALYMGREFHNVMLEFKKGRVVKATADKGGVDLVRILDTDKGARIIGELGLGNNYKIQKFTKDILFDEKIGGSIHLALGRGYKETLSKNKSAIHWDMIKDLRSGGELWFDGKLVQENGKWLI